MNNLKVDGLFEIKKTSDDNSGLDSKDNNSGAKNKLSLIKETLRVHIRQNHLLKIFSMKRELIQ